MIKRIWCWLTGGELVWLKFLALGCFGMIEPGLKNAQLNSLEKHYQE